MTTGFRGSLKAVAVLAVCMVAAACARSGSDNNFRENEEGIPAVEAVEVMLGTLPLEERLSGSVRARNQTEIYAEVSGQIVEVLANDGDQVEAGDPLVRIRDTDYQERLRQAEAGLQVARARVQQAEAALTRFQATLRRLEAMAERNLSSAADLETAQADALSAEADVALMRAQMDQAESLVNERRADLAETVVRAPITGLVGTRIAEVGQLTNTSEPLFVIGDTTDMLVNITLTQRMLGDIDIGTSVNIFTDVSPENPIEASITRISPFLHAVTRTTQAEIEVERPGDLLRPGMFVTVDVLYGETEAAPLIPNTAIYRHPRDGREGVFAASLAGAGADPELPPDAARTVRPALEPVGPVEVRFVPIELVARGRLTTAVRGVAPGDWVVTLGHHLLSSEDTGLALIQPTPWDHIMRLQQMQTRDLLEVIRARQEALSGQRVIQSLN